MAEDDEVNLIAQNVVADEEDEILTESPARKQPVASLGKVHRDAATPIE